MLCGRQALALFQGELVSKTTLSPRWNSLDLEDFANVSLVRVPSLRGPRQLLH